MDVSLLWRAAAIQVVAVAALFALLIALPLPSDFFREHGSVVGPLSWLACSLATGRLLGLGLANTLVVALASGAAAGLVGLLASHAAGLVVGVALFGVVAATRGRGQATQPKPVRAG